MKHLLLAGLALFMLHTGIAQDYADPGTDSTKSKKEKPKKDDDGLKKVFVGGGFGLGLSSSGGSLNVAPMIGYNLHKRIQVGTKFTYWYVWQRLNDPNNVTHKVQDNIYALSLFSRLIIWKGLYAHIEPEYMNRSSYSTNVWEGDRLNGYSLPPTVRTDVFNFYVGGGFYQGFSGNSGMFVQLLWNLNQTTDSYYANPYLQIGFAF
ncbi:MAG: hypothetical protein KDC83_14765 [Flavobacteriales bacterium]|nr:hypothetical protein [Flavobacteriales bacterium]